jgi:hypothetical protein
MEPPQRPADDRAVGALELFFDLVFVYSPVAGNAPDRGTPRVDRARSTSMPMRQKLMLVGPKHADRVVTAVVPAGVRR